MNTLTRRESEPNTTTLPLVCACVITYNGKRFLPRCFETIQLLTDYKNYRLVLVDNGSSDGSGDYVRENFRDVEVLRVDPNAGYAGAANRAVARARQMRAKYVVLMNDDIAVLHSHWLSEAIHHAEHDPRLGIITFAQEVPEERFQTVPALVDVDYLNGFVMVIPLDLFDQIGMYDEEYSSYGEEDDFGARAQAVGYRLVRFGIPFYHFGGGTNQKFQTRSAYLQMRNGIRFCLKNRGPLHAMMRAMRILDVAFNPWPISFDQRDVAHCRMRNSGNIVVNLGLWGRAVSWNIVRLPQTLRIRAAERRLVRAARARFTDLTNGSSQIPCPGRTSRTAGGDVWTSS